MSSGRDKEDARASASHCPDRLLQCFAAVALLISPAAAEHRSTADAEVGDRQDPPASPKSPVLVMPGLISTAEWSEVRITISPDGSRRVWGVIRNDIAPGKLTIVESVRKSGAWSPPRPVSFGSDANDFDPFFAPDGGSVLFFSNRAGGFGQDDLWSVSFDTETGRYGRPRNLGRLVNTPSNEWAPSLSGDGRTLLFSSDRQGGMGGHDLYVSSPEHGRGWSQPVNLGPQINTEQDDFDAVFVGTGMLVYASGDSRSGPVQLYFSRATPRGFATPVIMPQPFNCSDSFNLGPSWHESEPAWLYYSARCPGIGHGNMDLFKARLP